MSRFSIRSILSEQEMSENILISGVARTFNTRGDATELMSGAFMISSAIVEVVTTEDDLVRDGILQPEDVLVFVDSSEANDFIANDNKFQWRADDQVHSGVYVIREVINNKGHFEIHGKKESRLE